MEFSDFIGQKDVVQALEGAVSSDRVAHAYLFCGPAGIGKKTAAAAFAQLLLCPSPSGVSPCGKCPVCMLFENKSLPDLSIIRPEGASISIDSIRELQSDIFVRPVYSSRKVYLIYEADCMTHQAQTCLLKTLEEPPPYAVIILTAANPNSLLETVRSRALRYNFAKNTLGEVRQALRGIYGQEAEKLDFICAYSQGVIGTALELAGSPNFAELRERVVSLTAKLAGAQLLDIFSMYGFFEENKPDIDIVLDIMLSIYRDALVYRETGNENILINSDKKDIILLNAGSIAPLKLVRNIEIVEQARMDIKRNSNFQLSIEVMLMKLRED